MENFNDQPIEQKSSTGNSNKIFIIVICLLSVFLIVTWALYSFCFYHVEVRGSSMYPTLRDGDVLLANSVRKAKPGDVILIEGESGEEKLLIKRYIAGGGDTVTIKGGYVYVNGEKLIEEYFLVQGETFYPNVTDRTNVDEYTWVLKENEVFYLGDNRKKSNDSRYEEYGCCEEDQIIGVVTNFAIKIKGLTKVLNSFSLFLRELIGA